MHRTPIQFTKKSGVNASQTHANVRSMLSRLRLDVLIRRKSKCTTSSKLVYCNGTFSLKQTDKQTKKHHRQIFLASSYVPVSEPQADEGGSAVIVLQSNDKISRRVRHGLNRHTRVLFDRALGEEFAWNHTRPRAQFSMNDCPTLQCQASKGLLCDIC